MKGKGSTSSLAVALFVAAAVMAATTGTARSRPSAG